MGKRPVNRQAYFLQDAGGVSPDAFVEITVRWRRDMRLAQVERHYLVAQGGRVPRTVAGINRRAACKSPAGAHRTPYFQPRYGVDAPLRQISMLRAGGKCTLKGCGQHSFGVHFHHERVVYPGPFLPFGIQFQVGGKIHNVVGKHAPFIIVGRHRARFEAFAFQHLIVIPSGKVVTLTGDGGRNQGRHNASLLCPALRIRLPVVVVQLNGVVGNLRPLGVEVQRFGVFRVGRGRHVARQIVWHGERLVGIPGWRPDGALVHFGQFYGFTDSRIPVKLPLLAFARFSGISEGYAVGDIFAHVEHYLAAGLDFLEACQPACVAFGATFGDIERYLGFDVVEKGRAGKGSGVWIIYVKAFQSIGCSCLRRKSEATICSTKSGHTLRNMY